MAAKSINQRFKKKKPVASKTEAQQTPFTKSRLLLFRLIALLVSFLILVLLEIILRITGYGHDLHLFIEKQNDKSCWVMNPYASDRYFTDSENATVGNTEPFKKHKIPGTFRIFVLGESTTIGFPYGHNGSFHRWLQYRLMHTFPDKDIEIINVSLTAVNSYTVLEFGREITKYDPDAVLIYVGHNEYYGALGVGSTSHLGNNQFLVREIIRLRGLRLIQLMGNTISGITKKFTGKKINEDEGLMIRMPADQRIPYGSRKYEMGIRQFDYNINKVCQLFSEKKIPVFISNLVSNEKDLKPFISDSTNANISALFQYQQAQLAYNRVDFMSAKQLFVKAKDLDLLRFRAPEEMNSIIIKITKKYPGVYLVDTKSVFEQHSPHGILGNETILEHVHPNLYGYALLSDAFFQSFKQHNIIDTEWKDEMSFDQLIQQMPIMKIDSLKGQYLIYCMKKAWPFNNNNSGDFQWGSSMESNIAENMTLEKISWNEAMSELLEYYKKTNDLRGGLKVTEAMILEYPMILPNYYAAVNYCEKLRYQKEAVAYLKKAFRLKPDVAVANKIVSMELNLDRPEQTIPFLNYMISNNKSKINYGLVKKTVVEIVKLKNDLQTDQSNIKILNQLAINYLRIGRLSDAEKFAKLSLKEDGKNKIAQEVLKKIKEVAPAVNSKQ